MKNLQITYNVRCPKCNGTCRVDYVPEIRYFSGPEPDYMKARCMYCGYSWDDKTKIKLQVMEMGGLNENRTERK